MTKVIVKGLSEYLGIPIIRFNQTGEPPAYPYGLFSIITPMSTNKGTYGKYEDDVDRKSFTQTWSITIQSDDNFESITLTNKAHDWFEHVGRIYLNDNKIIVQSVENVTNRDNLLTIEYEYRNGFDVVFLLTNEVANPDTETIETVVLGNGEIDREPTADELVEKLEQRLTGR